MTAPGEARSRRTWIAVLAIYALALQLVFGNPTQVRAAAADLPTVLCTSHGLPDHGPGEPHSPPDCCLQGCCALGSMWLAAPGAVLKPRLSFALVHGTRPPRDVRGRLRGGDPRLTRGPPIPA